MEDCQISICFLLSNQDEKNVNPVSIPNFKCYISTIKYNNQKIIFFEVKVSEKKSK